MAFDCWSMAPREVQWRSDSLITAREGEPAHAIEPSVSVCAAAAAPWQTASRLCATSKTLVPTAIIRRDFPESAATPPRAKP